MLECLHFSLYLNQIFFTSVNQINSYATRSATRGAFIWQAASNKYGKRALKHFGPKIWDCIDPTLYELSSFAFKKHYRNNLIAVY